jgi:hypothetical protein
MGETMSRQTDRFTRDYGTENRCPDAMDGHKPDWGTLTVGRDGSGKVYLDVTCERCGRSGCVGTVDTLADKIDW